MIEAVQLESNALDLMRGRLKELDTMKTQLTTLTRRLLDAEKSNLNLNGNLVKLTDSYNDLKKSKSEVHWVLFFNFVIPQISFTFPGGIVDSATQTRITTNQR